jgi:hypothetical protein
MATQQGPKAVLFSVPDVDVKINGTSLARAEVSGLILKQISVTPTSSEVRTENEAGLLVNVYTYNHGVDIAFVFQPQGTTAANALAANSYFPKNGDVLLLLDAATTPITYTDGSISDAGPDGKPYRVKSATKNAAISEMVTWNITVEGNDNVSSWTPLL